MNNIIMKKIGSKKKHLLAWLSIPFPFSIGITEVEAVLNDNMRPSELNGFAEPLFL